MIQAGLNLFESGNFATPRVETQHKTFKGKGNLDCQSLYLNVKRRTGWVLVIGLDLQVTHARGSPL